MCGIGPRSPQRIRRNSRYGGTTQMTTTQFQEGVSQKTGMTHSEMKQFVGCFSSALARATLERQDAAGFTNSASQNGDKLSTLLQLTRRRLATRTLRPACGKACVSTECSALCAAQLV